MNIILVRTIQGAVLSLGAPLGWLLINLISGTSLGEEFFNNIGLYCYMLFGTMLVFVIFGIFVGKKEELVLAYAIRDSLTGIYNLRFYSERLNEEISRAQRYQTPLSLIYFDLDHFKNVNDVYGHPAGDQVLRQVTDAVTNISRKHDVFARVGGEEFVLLLPRCNLEHALSDAERVRQTVADLSIAVNADKSINVTISLGVATLLAKESAVDFYKRADANLYKAKNSGRNCVVG